MCHSVVSTDFLQICDSVLRNKTEILSNAKRTVGQVIVIPILSTELPLHSWNHSASEGT